MPDTNKNQGLKRNFAVAPLLVKSLMNWSFGSIMNLTKPFRQNMQTESLQKNLPDGIKIEE